MTQEVKESPSEQERAKKVSDTQSYNWRQLEAEREKWRETALKSTEETRALREQIEELKEMLTPAEKDPFDDDDDESIDPDLKKKLQAKLAKAERDLEKKAEKIAKKTYEGYRKQQEEEGKKDFLSRLKKEFPDFEEVNSPENLSFLQEKEPHYLASLLRDPDEYERRKAAYLRIKELKEREGRKSDQLKEKIASNQRNPYHIPSASAPTSSALDFDISSKEAKDAAYKRLKDMQKGRR